MVDSHVLVGSCAQIGARVHLSAGVSIGGVLEPAGARPVIVEDGAFVGAGSLAARGRAGRGGRGHRRRRRRSPGPRGSTTSSAAGCSPARPTRRSPCRRAPWWCRGRDRSAASSRPATGLSVSVALLVKDRDAGHGRPGRPGGRAAMSVVRASAGPAPGCARGPPRPAPARNEVYAEAPGGPRPRGPRRAVRDAAFVYDLDVVAPAGRRPPRRAAAALRPRLCGQGQPEPRGAAAPCGAGAGRGRGVRRGAAARRSAPASTRRAS